MKKHISLFLITSFLLVQFLAYQHLASHHDDTDHHGKTQCEICIYTKHIKYDSATSVPTIKQPEQRIEELTNSYSKGISRLLLEKRLARAPPLFS